MGLRIKAAIAVVLLAAAFGAGWTANGWRLGEKMESARADAEQAAKEQAHADARAKGAVIDAANARLQARMEKQRVITREVTEYVEKERDPDDVCRLDPEWVRLHDKSAVPATDPAAGGDGETGSVTDVAALPVVTGNYRRCYEWRDRLITLQDWVRRTRTD